MNASLKCSWTQQLEHLHCMSVSMTNFLPRHHCRMARSIRHALHSHVQNYQCNHTPHAFQRGLLCLMYRCTAQISLSGFTQKTSEDELTYPIVNIGDVSAYMGIDVIIPGSDYKNWNITIYNPLYQNLGLSSHTDNVVGPCLYLRDIQTQPKAS